MTDSDRRTEVEFKVAGYFAQAVLIGKLPVSLEEYLKDLLFTDEEIAYGLKYAKLITKILTGGKDERC